MSRITISTCVSLLEKRKIDANGWKVPELIRLGIMAREGNKPVINRINELEETNKKLSDKVQQLARLLYKYDVESAAQRKLNKF